MPGEVVRALTLMGILAGADRCCQVTNRFSIFIWRSNSGDRGIGENPPLWMHSGPCPLHRVLTSALCHLDLQELVSMVSDRIRGSGHRPK